MPNCPQPIETLLESEGIMQPEARTLASQHHPQRKPRQATRYLKRAAFQLFTQCKALKN